MLWGFPVYLCHQKMFNPLITDRNMRKTYQKLCLAFLAGTLAVGSAGATDNNHLIQNSMMEKNLTLTQEWDKVFPQSDKVTHSKVTFHNR